MQIDKEYYKPFLIEPTKLTRLVDKIHEKLGDQPGTTIHDSFEVFLSGHTHEILTDVDSVLALDNSRKHRIERLLINCSAATQGTHRPEYEVQVDFGKEKKNQSGTTRSVEVSVRSEAPGWANRTLSEVEEQVERTWIQYGTPVFILLMLVIVLLVSIASQFVTFAAAPRTLDALRVTWLDGPDLDRVEQILRQNRTITDEEMREIETRRLRNIIKDQRPAEIPQNWNRRRLWFVLTLLALLVVCAIALLSCYPSRVFLWGDEIARYDAILQRRRTIWGIIIGLMVVGVGANLLSARLLSLFPQ